MELLLAAMDQPCVLACLAELAGHRQLARFTLALTIVVIVRLVVRGHAGMRWCAITTRAEIAPWQHRLALQEISPVVGHLARQWQWWLFNTPNTANTPNTTNTCT